MAIQKLNTWETFLYTTEGNSKASDNEGKGKIIPQRRSSGVCTTNVTQAVWQGSMNDAWPAKCFVLLQGVAC